MGIKIVRGIFMVCCIIMGALWAYYILSTSSTGPVPRTHLYAWSIIGGAAGCILALGVQLLLRLVTQDLFEKLSPALAATVLAMMVGYMVPQYIYIFWPVRDATVQLFFTTSVVLIFAFAGMFLGLTRASSWESLITAIHRRHFQEGCPKVIDTSVVIDGRIADLCHTGFIEGTLIVPRFVLTELQSIADSPDTLRRARGRRGLDILRVLQEPDSPVDMRVVEEDFANVKDVDGKIVRLARLYAAKIITNDLNLNKVAQIEGVHVLNINDLANALKPAVLPDERMQVKIVKEGKEPTQGVGYLADGTMVVVDGGRMHIGRDVSVVVTSVLQTSAGRMIFTKLQEA